MKKLHLIHSSVLLFVFLTSCWTIQIKPSELENKLVTLSRTQDSIEIVGHFRKDFTYWYALLGIVRLNHPNLDDYYLQQIENHKGDGICNLSMSTQYGISDVFNNALFSGLGYLIGYYTITSDKNVQKQNNAYLGMEISNFLFGSRTLIITGDVYKTIEVSK